MHEDRVYVPNDGVIRNMVLKEMNDVPYVGYSSYQKTIETVRKQYYWLGMKNDVIEYIATCLECRKFNVEH